MRGVREKRKFLVYVTAGKRFGNYLFALQVAVNAQVSPVADGVPQIGYKRGIAQVGKFGLVRIHFSHELAGNIKFQVIAIRTDDRFGESNGFITAGPVERGLEDHFFRRIALRLIEAGGGLGFAENVGYAVIADAVTVAEAAVRVVSEGAP